MKQAFNRKLLAQGGLVSESKDIIETIEQEYNKALVEYHDFLNTCYKESNKWKSEGDMYGWNFHEGMRAGSTWTQLFYARIRRKLEELKKKRSENDGKTL